MKWFKVSPPFYVMWNYNVNELRDAFVTKKKKKKKKKKKI